MNVVDRIRPAMRALRRAPSARAVGIPLYQAQARLRPGPPPRVLVNTMPKSGTHLATGLLRTLPQMRFSGLHLTAYDIARDGVLDAGVLHRRLDRVRTGQFASAHLPADPALVDTVDALGFRTLFVYRDPRDMAVSDVHYIVAFDRHPLHAALTALSPPERLRAVINGLPGKRAGLPLLEPMAERCRAYRGWLTRPGVLCVRFEDLVGSQGGGDDRRQHLAVAAVAAHVDRPLSPTQVHRVAGDLWSPRSSTFRRGRVDGWRSEVTEADTTLIKAAIGDDLIAMGYEDDDAW